MAVGLKAPADLLPVAGVQVAAVAAGLRYKGRPDLVLVHIDEGAAVASIYTLNRYAAAPVVVAKAHAAQAPTRALLINAGQANAGTGAAGMQVAQDSCHALADVLGLETEAVLPFSTGVIGAAPALAGLRAALPALVEGLAEYRWHDAACGIMTTDTMPKVASVRFTLGGKTVTATGMTKGSGMIRPNMATMLAFIATDACVDQAVLATALKTLADASFNRITVDGDTSTNDACVLIASGHAGNERISRAEGEDYSALIAGLAPLFVGLAQAIVRDGEGASKFVTIHVTGGTSEADCRSVAFTVAHSPLVKTALFASDANWGRILAAVGRAPHAHFEIDRVSLKLNGVLVAEHGAIASSYTEEAGASAMAKEEILIEIDLGAGAAEAEVWTCDFSHEYIRINAEYRS